MRGHAGITLAATEDAALLVEMRENYVGDAHPGDDPAARGPFEAATRAYVDRHLASGALFGVVGVVDGR